MTKNTNLYRLHYVLKYKIDTLFRVNIWTCSHKIQQACGKNKLTLEEAKL